MRGITITEAVRYTEQVFLEEGWITPLRLRKIRRDSRVIAIGFFLIALIPAILILILRLEV